ncbi:unnamed protein product [Anisakis simplex]|uniref:ZP domain-containing protein n=1 Tax=Anisakis simplex TaxID=6269 RepID=A0A0M3JPM7_ANISI|nr:unnamed protein product [Anisakis simplex]
MYEWNMENLELYRDLERSSGCEANRQLRTVREACQDRPSNARKSVSYRQRKNHKKHKAHFDDSSTTTPTTQSFPGVSLSISNNQSKTLALSIAFNLALLLVLSTVILYVTISHLTRQRSAQHPSETQPLKGKAL